MSPVSQEPRGVITSVNRSPTHSMVKAPERHVRMIQGHGIEGDAHAGGTVKHRAFEVRDPERPNLRQVHLIHAELHDELREAGFDMAPGQMGENVTTRGVDLLGLPRGTRLHLGPSAVVEVTGLRSPCKLLDDLQPGLMQAVLDRDAEGHLIRKAGVMAIVVESGEVSPGDPIRIAWPPVPHQPLEPV